MDLVCTSCGERLEDMPGRWRCTCGGTLDLDFSPSFAPTDIVDRETTLWRYRKVLPITGIGKVTLGEGMTPMLEMKVGDCRTFVKLESVSPTGSFKDRGSSVMISRLMSSGVRDVVEDSSGNAALSVAAYSARAGIGCRIFIPRAASGRADLLRLFGAEVEVVGTRKDASDAAERAVRDEGTVYASHVWDPYFIQGVKTFAYEVCEQMDWTAPDAVVLPVGNGTLFLGAYRGFSELYENDVIERIPTMIGVQASGCAPIYHGWKRGGDTYAAVREMYTLASGIAVSNPPRAREVIAAARTTGGGFITVAEAEIMSAVVEWHSRGVAVEPTGAAGLAGMGRYISENPDSVVVGCVTGSSIKAIGGKLDVFL